MNWLNNRKNIRLVENITKNNRIKRGIQFLIGCFIVSISYNLFIVTNKLVPGGVGGLTILLNQLFNVNIANTILIIDISLLILSFIVLGKEKTKASILGSLLFPLFVKMTENINVWLQIDTSQYMLATLMAGLLSGFGAGMVFKAGFTTGGTDIINQIISKYTKISIGKSMLYSDGLIVLGSGIFLGLNSMMYSIIILYIMSIISDRVILGISDSKMFIIVTDEEEKVRDYIINSLGHGITIFKATGGYKKYKENVLMTALPTKDYYKLKKGINEIDKDAFFIITDAYEVFGGE